jgi:hypothetical protein
MLLGCLYDVVITSTCFMLCVYMLYCMCLDGKCSQLDKSYLRTVSFQLKTGIGLTIMYEHLSSIYIHDVM